ncbi:MAG: HNH endonuclease [Prevotella sp.]|nr:HNH endonuclease [Prevotella sp.]
MRLWVKTYGKETKVHDFAGRIMVKGAYNDRNSDFGWNVDHVLPQSKGGTTSDHNLVCCHILTNDEKADKFPCFTANEIKFEILKVQNHYEIRKIKSTNKEQNNEEININFFDSAAGIRYFKKLKGLQNKPRFVGHVIVKLSNLNNTAVTDFIEEIFSSENVDFVSSNGTINLVFKNYNMPLKENISNLLDKCILLNTYLDNYFKPIGYIDGFDIYYQVDCYTEKFEMYNTDTNNLVNNTRRLYGQLNNSLFINGLVWENTEAKSKVSWSNSNWTEYCYVYTKLQENLKKEVSEK